MHSTSPPGSPGVAYPDPLEEIFLRVEEESARRALEAQSEATRARDRARRAFEQRPHSSQSVSTMSTLRSDKARRRGSVSISRISQDDSPTNTTIPLSSTHPPLYDNHAANASTNSFASGDSHSDSADIEHDHVTQMHSIAPKQSITKTVSSLVQRRLSRTQSATIIRPNPPTAMGFPLQSTSETRTELVSNIGSIDPHRHSTTTEIVASGGRRRMTVSGVIGPVGPSRSAPVPASATIPTPAAYSTGTVRSTNSSLSSNSKEKDKDKDKPTFKNFSFSNKFRRRSKQDPLEETS